jgi:ubiquinone/menaquinone biosynthesis C-methylase UbiE
MNRSENPNEAKWQMSEIYFENRYDKPKQTFKMTLDILKTHFGQGCSGRLLDIGTAEGALPYFLLKNLTAFNYTAIESDRDLVELANQLVPQCKTLKGDANDMRQFEDQSFDAITCLGVLSIFDDFRVAMDEILRLVKKNGIVIINNMWNSFPIDLIVKVRHATEGPQHNFGGWEAGWNMLSIKTMSEYLKHHPRVKRFVFDRLIMEEDILPRPENCLRSWTSLGWTGERELRNGIGRVLDKRILTIYVE